MQKFLKSILVTALTVCTSVNIQAQGEVFLSEGFESINIPTGWGEQKLSGLKYWVYQTGGGAYSSLPEFKHPLTAYTGTRNALFFSEGVGPKSRLYTPAINLSYAIKPVLSFWLTMDEWDGSTDELKVYYRTKSYLPWVLLDTYSATLTVWTKKEIILPPEAKVSTLQIAFEAKSNYGWGVCIDDVLLDDRGVLPRTVNTVNMYQTKEIIASGTSGNPISFVEVEVSGNSGALNLTQANLTYNGSDINDINSFNLFYTRDSIFTPTTAIVSTPIIVGNSIQFTGFTQALQSGLNYIWITANVKSNAAHGNAVDIELPANGLTVNSLLYPSVSKNPNGNSAIEQSIIFTDFENTTTWTLNNSWAIGVPLGGGTYDPNYAYNGTKVLATNLNGNYPSNIQEATAHTAISPTANATYFKAVNLRYKRWLNIESTDKGRVWLSNDGGASWSKIMENQLQIQDRIWKYMIHDVATLTTRKSDVKVKFSIDETDNTTEYGGWNVDNFAITGDFIANDVGVKSMVTPISKCGLTSTETVKVIVKNFGGATVNTPFNVGYSLDNGATWVTQSFASPINSEQEVEFTFTEKANFSVAGLMQLKFKTYLTGDEDTHNDTYSTTLYVYPQVIFPYQTSFEASNGNWYSYGTNNSWAWGVPAGANLNKTSDGTKAWVTNLSSTYNINEFSYLESPCFDLSTALYPVLAFDYMMQTEAGEDGFTVEYSIDGGLTWSSLPANANYSSNWYNTATVTALGKAGWSVNQANYITAKNLLPNNAIGVNGVKFRFVFASNSSNSFEGLSIDQFKVYELPNDISITALTSPVNACEIGNAVKLTFNVKNIGYKPMLSGQTIPIKVKVDNAEVVLETPTLASDFNKNDVLTYTTANNYNVYAAGAHSIKVYSDLTIDDNRVNDTLNTTVTVTGMPGYTLGSDIGTMNTDTIILDAGAYSTYQWHNKIPADFGTWANDVTTQTLNVGASSWGLYAISVINGNGCEKKDTIEIIASDKDLGIISINNLSNSCTHPTPISPEVTIKHFGDVNFTSSEEIPLVITINGIVALRDTFLTPLNWVVGSTEIFTFSEAIDLSQKGTYNIAIFTNLPKDLDKSNDTTKKTVLTYGEPTVSLPINTISSTRGDTLKFGVPAVYGTYLWEQKLMGETTWTGVGTTDSLKLNVVPNSLRSATYRITVTNTCGNAEASVFVNAQDLGVFAIDEPLSSACYKPEGTIFKMRIKNFGQDVYKEGTSISAVLSTQSIQKNMTFNLSADLTPGNMALVSFNEKVMLEVGTHFVNISTSIDGDPNPDNDFIESTFTVSPSPSVSIEPDTLFKVFKSTSYLITPTYSADCSSYLWQDGYTAANYHITSPNYDKYKVVASSSYGCSATDSLILITTDLGITAIKSPSNKCALTDNTPVTFTLTNLGNKTIPTGTQIKVKTFVNGVLNTTQTVNLLADLLVDSSTDITLPGTINLGGLSNASIYAEIEPLVIKDVESTNNSMDKTVYSTGTPTISLGADREVHTFNEVLSLTGTFDTYAWYRNGAPVGNLTTYNASSTATYSVTVTDFTGCSGSDDVVLTFYVDDISMLTLNTPATSNGCNLGSTEAVNVTIKNTGTWTVPQSTVLELGFFQNNVKKTENYTLTSPFAPNETLEIPMVSTMDFTTKKTHDINVWVKLTNDLFTTNDTLKTQVASYPAVLVNLGTDIVSNKVEILDPGAGYSSYLWNTGATTQTITVSTTGEYWVEVSNAYGCKAKDFINYSFIAEPDLQLLELNTSNTSCTLSNAETVSVKIKNTGNYVFTTGEQISLELQNNGVSIATETFTLTADFLINTTLDYTFTAKVDLSAPSSYTVKVILSQVKDAQSTNNTLEKSITVWGNPVVDLGDNASICLGGTLTLNAGNTGTNYIWNTGETTRTIEVSATGLYWVDVTDSHSCTTHDEVQVNFSTPPTVTHSALTAVCLNKEPFTLSGGSPAGGVYTGSGASNVTFNPATAGVGTHTLTYTYTDPLGCSNSTTVNITVNSIPVVNLGDNRSITAPTELNAGTGFTSYKWQDNSTQQTFTVQATGLYSVTVTDNNGCSGYDEVYITFMETMDAYISSLISPVSRCYNNTGQPVTVEITNRGSKTFTAGEKIEVSYKVGTNQPKKEEITFTTDLAQNGKLQHTFSGTDLQNAGNYTLTCYTTIAGENGASSNFNVSIYTKPNLNLGPDTLRASVPYVLQSGIGNVTYLWNTGASSASITVSQHGKYWLRVTDANSCVASDTIVIHWPNSTEIISGIDAKIKLFPNPVKEELNVWIESEKAEAYTLELVNPQGLIVHKQITVTSDKITDIINVDKFTPGMYMLRISTDKGSEVFKVIVNKN